MKPLFVFLILASAARAQFIVNDPIHTIVTTLIQSNQVAQHAQVMAQWAQELERLNQQIRQLENQLNVQQQIKSVIGDPGSIGANVMVGLGRSELLKQYGDTLRAARRLANAIDSLKYTLDGTFAALEDKTALGISFDRQGDYYKRFAAIESQAESYSAVVVELDARSASIQVELGDTLVQLRAATTQSEVDKLNVRVSALNGQLAEIAARRRDEADKLRVQEVLNDNQAQKEKQDLLEKQIAEERSTLDAAASWQDQIAIPETEYK